MSSAAFHIGGMPRSQDVLGELLHSMSQPLTSLRCSLELSIDEVAERQQETVSAALLQTERVIGMVQLMREYLDADHSGAANESVTLGPAVRAVVEDLSSVAGLRGVELRISHVCEMVVPLSAAQLRLALQYLIGTFLEVQEAGCEVAVRLDEDSSGALLLVEGTHRSRLPSEASFALQAGSVDPVAATLRGAKLAIARRILESAGGSLVQLAGRSGFAVRFAPRSAYGVASD